MTASLQRSLLDLAGEPQLGPFGKLMARTQLAGGAWVDVRPGWLSGAADLFGRLVSDVPWCAERRQMYERMVYQLGHGDLLVMGGSCQRTWEHAVPKTARPVGPRISVQFRPRGVR